jgi:hypothetical protein
MIIITIGGIVLLNSCNIEKQKNTVPVFDNETTFVYDEKSKLTMDSFDGITTMTELNIKYPMESVRQNGEEYYTVYSLKDKKLAYVIFLCSPNTGVTFLIKEIVEYSYSSPEQEQKLLFLLPQDLPKNILK